MENTREEERSGVVRHAVCSRVCPGAATRSKNVYGLNITWWRNCDHDHELKPVPENVDHVIDNGDGSFGAEPSLNQTSQHAINVKE